MSASKPTRSRAHGLRIVSPHDEVWYYYASLSLMARDLSLHLYRATHRLDHDTEVGDRVPFTVVEANGLCLTWIRKTPYQAEHTHYGATWRIRIEWKTYEVFASNGYPLQVRQVLGSVDPERLLLGRKGSRIAHGDRGHGPVPRIHKSRGGSGWFRGIRTSHEIRLNALTLADEGEIPARAARNPKNLPTAWEDFQRTPLRSWKEQRKVRRQWER